MSTADSQFPAHVPVKNLKPLQDDAHAAPRPELQGLSDEELLQSVQNPANGDTVVINTKTGLLADGNGRVIELQQRALVPNGLIHPDTLVPVDYYTPDLSMFPDL